MVYESDFYTTRRYRTSPSVTSYTISGPSRQVRVLPGLGKVHVSYTYDRLVPYVGHKRLTVVTPPRVYATRPSVLHREFERIENKLRPWYAYSATNRYLNSDSAVRTYYINYPISGDSSYYTTVSYPSSPYLPKTYRWYYSWPREYYSYPYRLYYSSYCWPEYRPYFTRYLRSLYLGDYWPSAYYWKTYWPYYRSLDYEFSELEDKIDNMRKTIYLDYPYPIKAVDYPYYPLTYKTYRPLTLYYDYYWPISSLNRYRSHWPYYPYYRYLYYKYTLPSDRYYHLKGIFDDETRLIRAQTASLLKRIHDPVPRVRYSWPTSIPLKYHDNGLPVRLTNDYYIHKLLTSSSKNPNVSYTTYYTEPVRRYIGPSHLSCISYYGDRPYSRRSHLFLYEDPMRSDIQLLSYYINKFKHDKAAAGGELPAIEHSKVPLSPARPSRKFTAAKPEDEDAAKEMQKIREARAARMAFLEEEAKNEKKHIPPSSAEVEEAARRQREVRETARKQKEEEEKKAAAEEERKQEEKRKQEAKKRDEEKKKAEDRRLAEERRIAEEKAAAEEEARRIAQAKKEEAERKAELARQEELAAKAAAERAAELERQAELARQEELAKQAELERMRKEEEERLRLEEEKRLEEEAKAEEERKQLARLEELAKQAEEEREAELARQAEELAELARQEAELAEQAKKEAEEAELKRQEEELAELERQEAELAELERKEKELAEQAKIEAEAAKREAELAELARQEAELAELERQQAELDALEAEAKALEADYGEPTPEPVEESAAEEPTAAVEEEPAQSEAATEDEEDEDAKRQREMDALIQRKYELAELERQQAELDALEAEARAMAEPLNNNDDYDEPAIAEDTPIESEAEE